MMLWRGVDGEDAVDDVNGEEMAKTALMSVQMLEITAETETTVLTDQMMVTEQSDGAEGEDGAARSAVRSC